MKAKKEISYEIICGVNSIIEMLASNKRRLLTLWTTHNRPKAWKQIAHRLPLYPFSLKSATPAQLTARARSSEHQKLVAAVSPFPFVKKLFSPAHHKMLLLLDRIQDPHNVGAIIRSAYCTGITGIVMTEKKSAPLNTTAHKASAGYVEHVAIYKTTSLLKTTADLKKLGYTIYLATIDGETIDNITFSKPLCLVIGNEHKGISQALFPLGKKITLPQITPSASYNASVAAGILLFHLTINS